MALASMTSARSGQDDPGREFAFTSADFHAIAQRVKNRTGIVLGESKRDLVYGRLGRRLRALRCGSFSDYLTPQPSPHFFYRDSKVVGLNAKSPRHLQPEAGPADRVTPRVT